MDLVNVEVRILQFECFCVQSLHFFFCVSSPPLSCRVGKLRCAMHKGTCRVGKLRGAMHRGNGASSLSQRKSCTGHENESEMTIAVCVALASLHSTASLALVLTPFPIPQTRVSKGNMALQDCAASTMHFTYRPDAVWCVF